MNSFSGTDKEEDGTVDTDQGSEEVVFQ